MTAQHQAAAAGVSYDLLSEADLTNVAKLAQYSALIFPSMENVQSSQVSAIASALSHVVYDYHVPIITAGNFLTNDQTGAPLPGNSYANMQALLNVTLNSFGTATYSVTADATALANHNPVVAGYAAGELIGGASGQFAGTTAGYYTNTGYLTFSGVTQPATVLADIDIQGGTSVAGVVQPPPAPRTPCSQRRACWRQQSAAARHPECGVRYDAQPVARHDAHGRRRQLACRYGSVVVLVRGRPEGGAPGIYDALIPMLQQWKQQYGFVGFSLVNMAQRQSGERNSTNWAVFAPIYRAIIASGNEIGVTSYTHLIRTADDRRQR